MSCAAYVHPRSEGVGIRYSLHDFYEISQIPPRPPRSHIALPRQLMPSAATVDALNKKGGKVLGCIVEYFGCDFVD